MPERAHAEPDGRRQRIGRWLGPLLGAFFIHGIGEVAKEMIGVFWQERPGLDLILFGIILVLVLGFAPRGIAGLLESVWRRLSGGGQN